MRFDPEAHAVATTICPKCRVEPRFPCVTPKGVATRTHAQRRNPVEIAFGQGYDAGWSEGREHASTVRR